MWRVLKKAPEVYGVWRREREIDSKRGRGDESRRVGKKGKKGGRDTRGRIVLIGGAANR